LAEAVNIGLINAITGFVLGSSKVPPCLADNLCSGCNGTVNVLLLLPLFFSSATDTRPAVVRSAAPAALRAISACGAVTRLDVEKALGRPVSAGEERADGAETSCDFSSGGGQVTVTVHRLAAKLDLAGELANLKAAFPEARLRSEAGIGTQAYFLDIDEAGTQLHVLRGESEYVLVSILGFGEPGAVAPAARSIARLALGRLAR
jgi:hypothetical protein